MKWGGLIYLLLLPGCNQGCFTREWKKEMATLEMKEHKTHQEKVRLREMQLEWEAYIALISKPDNSVHTTTYCNH